MMKRSLFALFLFLLPTLCLAQSGTRAARNDRVSPGRDPLGLSRLDNILLVDGIRYKSLSSALRACALPGCIVYDNLAETFSVDPFAALSPSVSAEVHLMRKTFVTNASISVPNKSQLIGSGRGDAATTGTVIQAGPSFPRFAAVIEMGTVATSTAVRIENLTVDCANRIGAIGIRNSRAQEQSNIRHVLLQNCPASGLDVESSAAQNSGPYEDLEVLNNHRCTNCSLATVPIIVKNASPFRGVHGATVNSDGAVAPNVAVQVDSEGTYSDLHCEHVNSCLVIGSRLPVGAAIATNIECGPSVTDCVTFSSAFRSQNLTALNIASTTGNLLDDEINRNVISASMEGGSLAMYLIGNGNTQPFVTSSIHFNSRFPGMVLLGSRNGSTTHVAPAEGGNNTITDPAGSGTASLAAFAYCGATTGATQDCANGVQTLPISIWGDVLLNSTASQTVTKLPFTDNLYSCTGSDLTTATGIVSFSSYAPASVIIQETNGTNNDHLRYICIGH